ncbi:signal transduction histidine kinase [Kribbella steppae]|uniref:histidine kinase n=1 Tax=Kribbella steppae TaxID=2512223 RepID=A0A4R2GTN9_9ACTN|nr:HAMP domain-containing sensor histidine kinase [Kribbella steppae]TCO12217.1 signal transduction histidine kinase [Kribbella steppae]
MRIRVTLAAVLVVGFALVTGAFILVALLGSVLTAQVCTEARERASQLSDTPAVRVSSTRGELVQLIDRSGGVVGASDSGKLASPGSDCVKVEPPGYTEDFVFAAASVQSGGQVIVGRPLVDVLDSTRFVSRVLVVGVPVMMLVVGVVTWLVTGRVLAPVSAIRREVDEISATALHRRVPAVRKDEIGRLANTMNRMLDRLQRSQEIRQRFVSDASHELRSPIAAIRQHAEVAQVHPDSTTVDELATTVLAEDLRMQHLVDDLLVLARSDEESTEPPCTPVDLDDLVFAEAGRLHSATDLRIDTSAVSAGQVRGDATALARMIHNLADNAARHAHSWIAFGLGESDGSVVLTVSDDGPGIAVEDRARVFDRFVRLNPARSRGTGGSGLGLSIVAEVIHRHHGTVRIDGGATFEVRLPRADIEA